MKKNLISRISAWFVKNSRASILILVSVLVAGFLSYTTLLDREGFPEVQFPVAIVQGRYLVDDATRVSEEITNPLEAIIADQENVDGYQSVTTNNSTSINVTFQTDIDDVETAAQNLAEELENATIPRSAQFSVLPILPTPDGTNDLVFSISNPELDYEELKTEAEQITADLTDLEQVEEASIKQQFIEQTNPRTGETVENQVAFYRHGFSTGDSDEQLQFLSSVSIGVVKASSVDSVGLSESVRNTIAELNESDQISANTNIVFGGDPAVSVTSQITELEENTLAGLLVILVVTLVFLNWRASIISALFLPTALATTFFGLYLGGYTLNVISLFALILVIGLLVDDIIVIVEAIDLEKKQGLSGLEAVESAMYKVGAADVLGTITTIMVFVPMLAISGILGDFIQLIPVTVILTLLSSLVLALTLFAWLSSWLLPNYTSQDNSDQDRSGFTRFTRFISEWPDYVGNKLAGFVNSYTSNWWQVGIVLILPIAAIALSGIAFGSQVSFNIFPPAKDSTEVQVSIEFADETEWEDTDSVAEQVENKLKDYSDIVEFASYTGSGFQGGPDRDGAAIDIRLSPIDSRNITSVELTERLNETFADIDGATVEADVISQGPPPSEFDFEMQIFAEDLETLDSASSAIADFIEAYSFTAPDGTTYSTTEVQINNLDNIARQDGDRYVPIQVAFGEDNVPTTVTDDLETSISQQFKEERLDELGLDEDALGFDQGVESANAESFEESIVAFAAALVIMYGFLTVLFNSFTKPLLIFLAIPFGIAGVIPGLALSNNPFSFFVMIGIISLAGIVVNNTIILMDYMDKLRSDENMGIAEAAAEAIKVRFRPLATTSVTTIVGLTPLALSDPFWEPLALTVIFGLASSTILVLVAFPAYYIALESVRGRFYRIMGNLTS